MTDREAVAEVIIRYATSVDKRDLARYATCFTDDVEVTGFSGGPIVGLAPYVEWVAKALSRFARTQHLLGNHEIEITGDTAHMRTYVQATHVLEADPDYLLVLWAVYDDQMMRTSDGWKIARHHLDRLIPPRRIHAPEA